MCDSRLALRVTTLADLAAVNSFVARALPARLSGEYPGAVQKGLTALAARAAPALLPCNSYFVARIGGRIVGCCGWSWAAPLGGSSLGPRDMAYVRLLLVARPFGRCGVGRALMGLIVATARRGGVARLECISTATAEPFYRACGFAGAAPIEVALQPGLAFGAVQMTRRI